MMNRNKEIKTTKNQKDDVNIDKLNINLVKS